MIMFPPWFGRGDGVLPCISVGAQVESWWWWGCDTRRPSVTGDRVA